MSHIDTGNLKSAVGYDNADNDFSSSNVAANVDGSILERLEDLKSNGATTTTAAGSLFYATSSVTSSQIPNNTQTGGAITGAASSAIIIEDILINTDSTGLAGPTNIEFSTDNTDGATGAGAPIFLEAISALGANASESKKDATSHLLPYRLESGSIVYIHGDDAGGSGGGVATVTLVCRRVADGGALAGVDLTP